MLARPATLARHFKVMNVIIVYYMGSQYLLSLYVA